MRSYGLIAVERLKVVNLTRSAKGTEEAPGTNVNAKAGLNREILSQNWSLLFSQLEYKAEWAGREYVEVDPKHTSQDCHRCGARNHPKRSETYRCAACGLTMDRDQNAAINILAAGVFSRRSVNVGGYVVRRSRTVCRDFHSEVWYISSINCTVSQP